jgi:hypothetical protein
MKITPFRRGMIKKENRILKYEKYSLILAVVWYNLCMSKVLNKQLRL